MQSNVQMRILPLGTVGSEKVVYIVLDGWLKDKSLAYVYAKHLGRGYAAYVPFPKYYFEAKGSNHCPQIGHRI
jgi:hypothetical protein